MNLIILLIILNVYLKAGPPSFYHFHSIAMYGKILISSEFIFR